MNMATATKPVRALSLPTTAAPAEPPVVAQAVPVDPLNPSIGDRIAFAIWVACALFMATLLTYDTIVGLFR
jgi:hypothetical protein